METYGKILKDVEPNLDAATRSRLGKIGHEFRYYKFFSKSESFRRVKAKGYTAGFWGRSKKTCPVKAGLLQGAWLQGWQIGRDKRLEMKESKPERTGT